MDRKLGVTNTDLLLFQQSLQRVNTNDRFYEAFYARFIGGSKEVEAIFQSRDVAATIAKLRMTLGMVAEAAEGKPGLEMYLDMLGGIHRRLDVQARYFTWWREALMQTLSEYDPHFNDEIRGAWERVIDRVIDCMQQTECKNQTF